MTDASKAPWLQLTLEASRHTPEQLEEALLEAGALAVTLQDAGAEPVLEPAPGETPLWSRTRVTGLFDARTGSHTLRESLRQALGSDAVAECRAELLQDRDWVRVWLDDFHPLRFGRRLWVCPTGQIPLDPAAVNLRLDPGLAFGTGTHPTTALCLEWLDGADLQAKTVIDYGCGSGILAIAAVKLGAARAWAVDIDPQALLASRQNALHNGVAERIAPAAPGDLPAVAADILLANILAGPLAALAPRFSTLVRPCGRLVLAGILVQQAAAVQAAFQPWFSFATRRQREDWVLLEARRQD